jgi:primosomal replication protein N
VIEFDTLRYSPAGIPILNLTLLHESEQIEAAGLRKVHAVIHAVAAGPVAVELNKTLTTEQPKSLLSNQQIVQKQGAEQAQNQLPKFLFSWSGFLAAKRLGSKALQFHITEFKHSEN